MQKLRDQRGKKKQSTAVVTGISRGKRRVGDEGDKIGNAFTKETEPGGKPGKRAERGVTKLGRGSPSGKDEYSPPSIVLGGKERRQQVRLK